jgi:transposase-like protein
METCLHIGRCGRAPSAAARVPQAWLDHGRQIGATNILFLFPYVLLDVPTFPRHTDFTFKESAMSYLSQPHFHNEEAAYAFVESRVWPNGVTCPHCGTVKDRISKMQGKSTRIGAYKCYNCRKPFTVKVGTIFESSHIPLRLWLQGIYLVAASKKGISANQLHRTLGITLKSAWFMGHRIREAMKDDTGILGGGGSIVEADETFMTPKGGAKVVKAGHHRTRVLSLVSRDGKTRSFHVANVDGNNLGPILQAHIAKDTHLMTDGAMHYRKIGQAFDLHESTNHTGKQYAKDSKVPGVRAHSNTVESYFAILKRGITGTYHHVSEEHLQRYVDEFDFRFSNRKSLGIDDVTRAENLLKGVVGKRLTYQTTTQQQAQ